LVVGRAGGGRWWWLAGSEAAKEEEEEEEKEELLESGRVGWLIWWLVGLLVVMVVLAVLAGCPRLAHLEIQIAGESVPFPCWSPLLLAFPRRSWLLVSTLRWMDKDGG
jgi:hypothetical protein